METDIILEGFLAAEKEHGVCYINFVGDSDSSVYPTLVSSVPGWGVYSKIARMCKPRFEMLLSIIKTADKGQAILQGQA